jgi:glycosyltransferase involved in cell wall biosynthesis
LKVLHTVEFYSPSVGGMQEVVKQLSERLVTLGHDVTVATTRVKDRTEQVINGVKIKEFVISGNAVRGMKGETEQYRQFLVNSDFDVVTNFAAQQWATDLALPVLGQIKSRKVFVPTGFSGLYWPAYKGYFAQMAGWMNQYDANVFLSADYRDINFAEQHDVRERVLIPNGAGADEFLRESEIDIRGKFGIPSDHFLILHVGSHTGVKGHVEAIKMFKKANIKNATFLIVGNSFGGGCSRSCEFQNLFTRFSSQVRANGKRLIVTTLNRPETVAAYQQADMFLFPSNIECSPLVLFECLASKTPFLTTDVGNAAEILAWSSAGRLLPTTKTPDGSSHANVDASIKMLEEFYEDKKSRLQMAECGYAAWQERFTWEGIARQYEQLYLSVMGK